jgi:hypothetical protein
MKSIPRSVAVVAAIVTAAGGLLAGSGIMTASADAHTTFIGPLSTNTPLTVTNPGNGDQNPYGVAVIPETTGSLTAGNVLVSNFNDFTNTQGTGTTIVQISPQGVLSPFAQIDPTVGCPGGVGLTTALVVLRSGWVIVGSTPTVGGVVSGPGCLIVLNNKGLLSAIISGAGIDGPWDMTALDLGGLSDLFVTNVLDGTVLRFDLTSSGPSDVPHVLSITQIGSGFPFRTDPTALVVGPTGVGLGANGTLYVADTLDSRIAAIPGAVFRHADFGIGRTVSEGGTLNNPLGLAIAPNGDILTVNAGDGKIVETTPRGDQVASFLLDSAGTPPGVGALFGLAVVPGQDAVYFVDDNANTLNLFS